MSSSPHRVAVVTDGVSTNPSSVTLATVTTIKVPPPGLFGVLGGGGCTAWQLEGSQLFPSPPASFPPVLVWSVVSTRFINCRRKWSRHSRRTGSSSRRSAQGHGPGAPSTSYPPPPPCLCDEAVPCSIGSGPPRGSRDRWTQRSCSSWPASPPLSTAHAPRAPPSGSRSPCPITHVDAPKCICVHSISIFHNH